MGFSMKVTNTNCMHKCVYCYEHFVRETGKTDRPFDLDAMIAQLEKEWNTSGNKKTPPYLHGGEALTAGYETIETLLRKSFELAGYSSIQTYGYLIDDRYIDMFKRYKTSVGVSIDGPWPLNKARVTPGVSGKEATDKVMKNIYKMRAEGIQVSIICVLHKLNATKEHIGQLKDWIDELKSIGVNGGRLNLMHTDYSRFGKSLELTEDEAAFAWRELTRFVLSEHDGLAWQPMRDAVSILTGVERGTCIFGRNCLYYHANTEPVIFSDGSTGNCLKTAKTGNVYPRVEQPVTNARGFGGIRYEILPLIDQEYGGCKGCRYWRECGGGCPSEGLEGGDWRNRTRFCKAYYALFDEAEKLLRRLMPAIRLSVEATDEEYNNGKFWPPAFAAMDDRFVKNTSTWRNDSKRELSQRFEGKVKVNASPQSACSTQPNSPKGMVIMSDGSRHLDHMDTQIAEVA